MSKSTTPPCPAKISDKSKECCQRAGCRFRYNDEAGICESRCVGNGHMIDPDTCECSCDTKKWHTLLQPDSRTCKPCPENTKLFFNPPRCVECKGVGSEWDQINECTCNTEKFGTILSEDSVTCEACPKKYLVDKANNKCVPCYGQGANLMPIQTGNCSGGGSI